MVSAATILSCVITLLIVVLLPLAVLALFASRYRNQGIVTAWLLGAAGFFVTQIVIRVPIISILQTQAWFMDFSQKHAFVYVFSLAFTAGLFELAGRFAVAKFMEKRLTFRRSLAAGLGHGGIEAIVLFGMSYVNNLIYIVMINTGAFNTLLSELAASGGSGAQLELAMEQMAMIREQLISSHPAMFLLGAFERVLAMTAHVGMSMIVCYGVARKKVLPSLLLCLGIHTLIDLSTGLTLLTQRGVSQTTVYILIYSLLTLVAGISILVVRSLHRRWQTLPEKEVSL